MEISLFGILGQIFICYLCRSNMKVSGEIDVAYCYLCICNGCPLEVGDISIQIVSLEIDCFIWFSLKGQFCC